MEQNIDKKMLSELTLEELDKYVEQHNEEFEKTPQKRKAEFTFSVVREFGALSEKKNAPIFALVDWSGYLRYDIRKWMDDKQKPGKGITFEKDELRKFVEVVESIDLETTEIRAEYFGGKAKATIYDSIYVFSEKVIKQQNWKKEINIIDWGFGKKIDIRKWTDDYGTCSKGISLTMEEFMSFVKIAKRLFV